MSQKMKNSYWLYTSSNRWCFKSLLKMSIDPAHLICSGNIAKYSEFESYLPDEHFGSIASKIGAFLPV